MFSNFYIEQFIVEDATVYITGHKQVDYNVAFALILVNSYIIEVLFVIVLLILLTYTLSIVQPALALI